MFYIIPSRKHSVLQEVDAKVREAALTLLKMMGFE
jgi:hypothetical protein